MSDERSTEAKRIAFELERLHQEVRAIQHVLDDGGPLAKDEAVRRLRYLATCANRLADRVENAADATVGG